MLRLYQTKPFLSSKIVNMFLETESNGFAPSKSINQQILPEQDLDVKEHLAVFDAFKPIEVLSALHDGKPQLYEVSDAIVPQTQLAVITPIMGKSLNLQTRRIPVRKPGWGEVVVRISWTGMCRSVFWPIL